MIYEEVKSFSNAVDRLKEGLEFEHSDFSILFDGNTKRLQFNYSACLKALRAKLGLSRDIKDESALNKAFEGGIISNIDIWDRLRKDLDYIYNDYEEDENRKIYNRIGEYLGEYEYTLRQLRLSDS